MLPPKEMTKVKAEIENLKSALTNCTNTPIREVIEIRIEERRLKSAQLQAPRSELH
jgi:hypothetical protein